ncbi:hypothetical protein HYU13_02770 [Candidatus Woesearchaeota archaeon]|nr:hypothetical protein [Candidatus Woesearchaeota archaeon]
MSQRGAGVWAGIVLASTLFVMFALPAFADYSPSEPSHGTLYTDIIDTKMADQVDIRTNLLISEGNLIVKAGNVGIGTDAPSAKLEIGDTAGPLLVQKWYGSAGRYYGIENYDNRLILADLGARRILEADPAGWTALWGSIGIGTTTPLSKLHINDSSGSAALRIIGAGTGSTHAEIVLEATGNTPNYRGLGLFMYDAAGGTEWYAGRPYATSDQYQIGRASGASHQSSVAQASNAFLTVKSNGNVGIGTATPAANAKLDVAGNVRATAFQGDGSALQGVLPLAGGALTGVLMLPSNGLIVGTSQLVVSGGNVGIGTATPGTKLHAIGGTNLSAGGSAYTFFGSADASGQIEHRGSSPYIDFSNDGTSDYDARLVLENDNSLGVYGGDLNVDSARIYAAEGAVKAQLFSSSGTGYVGTFSNNNFVLRTNDADVMTLTTAGNVGIGTTTPDSTAKLDVAGKVKATSFEGAFSGVNSVPSGAVIFYDGTSCPTGWSRLSGSQGRVIVGLTDDAVATDVKATVGTAALSNKGTRTITQVPSHKHSVNPASVKTSSDGAHAHDYNDIFFSEKGGTITVYNNLGSGDSDNDNKGFTDPQTTDSAGAHQHTVDIPATDTTTVGSASVDVTMPYIQLLVCRKD